MSLFIKNIEDLQNAGLPVDSDTDLDVIDRHFIDSEEEFVKPVMGPVLFEAVKENLTDERFEPLLPYLQAPVAYNGYYRFNRIPGGQLNHMGFHRSNDQYTEHAPKWELDALKETLICKADHALDALIRFLQENITEYTEWREAPFFKSSIGAIIPTADIFNQWVQIGCSGRVFNKLGLYRRWAEKSVMRIICKPLYDKMIAELTDEEGASPEILELLEYVRPMVAFETMFRGIKKMTFNYTDSGIYTYSYSDGTLSKTSISMTDAARLETGWRMDWEEARENLLAFLADNLDEYPDYRDSPCYKNKSIGPVVRYDNSIEKKHFGL